MTPWRSVEKTTLVATSLNRAKAYFHANVAMIHVSASITTLVDAAAGISGLSDDPDLETTLDPFAPRVAFLSPLTVPHLLPYIVVHQLEQQACISLLDTF